MDEALRMAKQTAPKDPEILALHAPPLMMCETSPRGVKPRASSPPPDSLR
jgi:hypothetical protein